MSPPKLQEEINLLRLISSSTRLAESNFPSYKAEAPSEVETQRLETNNKRLENYVEMMKTLLDQLEIKAEFPIPFTEYHRKIAHFEKLLQTASYDTNIATDHLLVTSAIPSETDDEVVLRQRSKKHYESETVKKLLTEPRKTTSIWQRRSVEFKALVGGISGNDTNGTRKDDEDEYEATLKKERELQNEIANDMLTMTDTFKETALTAQNVMKKDLGELDELLVLADGNLSKLDTVNVKLKKHNEVYGSWWIQITLLIVTVIFFMMILFIKFTSPGE